MKHQNWISIILLLCSGCATTADRFSVISTRNDPSLANLSDTKVVSGESCRRDVLFIPISGRSSLGDAVDAALAKSPDATALTDTKVQNETLFTLVYNYHCVAVEGHPRGGVGQR
jgi:hypothetical protein